ncbi:UNVERIFIED_CONTAM: hypothetical protein K2H54_021917 [Gekko kuhli]
MQMQKNPKHVRVRISSPSSSAPCAVFPVPGNYEHEPPFGQLPPFRLKWVQPLLPPQHSATLGPLSSAALCAVLKETRVGNPQHLPHSCLWLLSFLLAPLHVGVFCLQTAAPSVTRPRSFGRRDVTSPACNVLRFLFVTAFPLSFGLSSPVGI